MAVPPSGAASRPIVMRAGWISPGERAAGAVNASLVTLLVPVSALLLGTLVLGEVFTLRQATGMAVIFLGLMVTDGRMARYALRRARGG